MIVRPIRTRLFRAGDSLEAFLVRVLPRLREEAIVVVTSKIVALAEGRVAPCPDDTAFAALVKAESEWAIETKYTWLTVKDGMVMASAGIDRSNADGVCVLLPRDPYRRAAEVRRYLLRHYRLHNLGVIITDSRLMPLREGITGVAIGYAGFKGVRDYRGTPDLFGRKLTMTRTNVADSLAAAAVLTMGEGRERQPLAIIEGAPVIFTERVRRNALTIDPREDIYRPFFDRLREMY